MLDAERMEGLDASAQRERAKVAGTDFGRRSKGASASADAMKWPPTSRVAC